MGIPWREALAASFIKRSNKDLGRVLALATMVDLDDYRPWSRSWLEALRTCFPNEWSKLALWAGAELRALLGSGNDFEEAYHKGGWNFIRSLLRSIADRKSYPR